MEPRPQEPGDAAVMRALATLRTAAFVLRDLDFETLDELDQRAIAEWEAQLVDARRALARVLRIRGADELEVPSRGQLEKFDMARVEHHVRGLSKTILAEFERVDATPGSLSQLSTSILVGLVYSLRSIEQFILWQEPSQRRRSMAGKAVKSAPATAAAPADPPPPPAVVPEASPAEPPALDPALAEDFFPLSAGVAEWAPPSEEPPARPASAPALSPTPSPASLPALPEAPPAPLPVRRDVDLSSYFERPDEYGGVVRMAPLSLFHGCSRGPEHAKRERALDATRARLVVGGLAFALADGVDSSIGALVASAIATTTFCEVLSSAREEPRDITAALLGAVEKARRQLQRMLESLIESADDSDAIRRLRGGLAASNVRRILAHTLKPEPALKHVMPALAVSFVGGLIFPREDDAYEMSFVSVGPIVAERKPRAVYTDVLVSPDAAAARLAPGEAVPWNPSALPLVGPVELKPGDIALLGSAALRRGYDGPALERLPLLAPDILLTTRREDDHAFQILKQASAAADRFEALETKRGRSGAGGRIFADDLSLVLITIPPRGRPDAFSPAPAEPAPEKRDAKKTLTRLLKKPL